MSATAEVIYLDSPASVIRRELRLRGMTSAQLGKLIHKAVNPEMYVQSDFFVFDEAEMGVGVATMTMMIDMVLCVRDQNLRLGADMCDTLDCVFGYHPGTMLRIERGWVRLRH